MPDDAAALLQVMTERLRRLEGQVKEQKEAASRAEQKYNEGRIESVVKGELKASGCQHPDLVWKLQRDRFRLGANGEVVAGSPSAPDTVKEYIDLLRQTDDSYDIYFKPKAKESSNTKSKTGPDIYGKVNPFESGDSFNATKAAALSRSNPALALAFFNAAKTKGKLGPGMSALEQAIRSALKGS